MLRLFWFVLFHLLGLASAAVDVAIVGSIGQIGVEWTGWLAIGFYWWVAVGVAMGWKRFVGRPVTLVILGFYVMATLLLLGLSFSQKLSGASLLLAFAPLATALVGRIILDIILHARKPRGQKSEKSEKGEKGKKSKKGKKGADAPAAAKAQAPPTTATTPAPAKPASLHDTLF